jgi:hypothetical protein
MSVPPGPESTIRNEAGFRRLILRVYSQIFRLYRQPEDNMTKEARVGRKNMRLRQDLLDRARRILGARTETETVEMALELVTFRKEVTDGIRRVDGSGSLRDIYAEEG